MSVVVRNLDQIREFWNSMAEYYARTSAKMTSKVYRTFMPFLNLQSANVVVEAGCGPGNGIDELLSALPPTAKVLANDISSKFVQMVQAKALDRVEVVEANNEQLPFPDDVADRYVANMSLHIVEFPDRMASEAFRVLKSGGVAVFSLPGDRPLATMFDLMAVLAERFGKVAYRSFFHISDPAALRQVLTAAGFTRIVLFHEIAFIPVLDAGALEGLLMGNPEIQGLYGQVEEDKKPEFLQCLRDYLNNLLSVKQEPLAVHARIALAFKP